MGITITEALAEIKTIQKKVEKKRETVGALLCRQDGIRDPMEKMGGSFTVIQQERQGIDDLEMRVVALRRGIQAANERTVVTINGVALTIADWLVWRRDVAPGQRAFLSKLRSHINAVRDQAKKSGNTMVGPGTQAEKPSDFVVSVNEHELAKEIEQLEDTLGQLDGQLSLKNATVALAV